MCGGGGGAWGGEGAVCVCVLGGGVAHQMPSYIVTRLSFQPKPGFSSHPSSNWFKRQFH